MSLLPIFPRAALAAWSTRTFPSTSLYTRTQERIIGLVRLLIASKISITREDFHLFYPYRIERALLLSIKILINLGYYLGLLVSYSTIRRASLIVYSSISSTSFPLPRGRCLFLKERECWFLQATPAAVNSLSFASSVKSTRSLGYSLRVSSLAKPFSLIITLPIKGVVFL